MSSVSRFNRAMAIAIGTLSAAFLLLSFNVRPAASLPQTLPQWAGRVGEYLLQVTGNYTAYLPIIRLDPTPTPTPTPTPFAFYDTFDNPASGWPIKSFNPGDPFPPGPYASGYGQEITKWGPIANNVFNVKTVAAWNSWVYPAPVQLADPRNFTVELIGKSAQDFMWLSSWGVYFNANASRTKMYTIQIYQDGDSATNTKPDYHARRWDNFNGTSDAQNVELEVKRRCSLCISDDYKWNRIKVIRSGDILYVYLGSDTTYRLQATYYAPWYTSAEYTGVGVFNGNFEWSDWLRGDAPTYQVDNFYVNPARYP
jgi:hypothetical protein